MPAFAGRHCSSIFAMCAHELVDSREQHDASKKNVRKVHLWIGYQSGLVTSSREK